MLELAFRNVGIFLVVSSISKLVTAYPRFLSRNEVNLPILRICDSLHM